MLNDDPNPAAIIGYNIKKYRKKLYDAGEKEYTQQGCADKIGVKQQQWSGWESGKITPETDSLIRIARVLEVTVADLWTEEQKRTPPATAKEITKRDLMLQCIKVTEVLTAATSALAGDLDNALMDTKTVKALTELNNAGAEILEKIADYLERE